MKKIILGAIFLLTSVSSFAVQIDTRAEELKQSVLTQMAFQDSNIIQMVCNVELKSCSINFDEGGVYSNVSWATIQFVKNQYLISFRADGNKTYTVSTPFLYTIRNLEIFVPEKESEF